MRLIRIEPAKTDDDPIVCSLSEVKFRKKPKFHALSYMWGVGPDQCEITLNGVNFKVRQNLADALRYLRTHANDTSYWIDAICINQDDASDKNRQVGMMHHIYFRAETVVVWLGKRYAGYETSIPDLRGLVERCKSSIGQPKVESSAASPRSDAFAAQQSNEDAQQRKLAEELYNDGYWNRLWIIQEIERARNIKVCLGNSAVEWDLFICFITMHNLGSRGPVKLNRQRQGKYTGSNTLVQLLANHKEALCQDNKDKVYGLIGLASDARGFVIDYDKSLIQIWTDVMEFMNKQDLFAGNDIVYIGGLVKSLLMPSDCRPLQQILREYAPGQGDVTILTDPKHFRAFELEATVIGFVTCVGPRPHDIVGNPDVVDKWAEQVQRNFRSDLGPAHEESDLLVRTILDLDDITLSKKCFDCRSTIQWSVSVQEHTDDKNEAVKRFYTHQQQFRSISSGQMKNEITSAEQSDTSRLFQMSMPGKKQTLWKMGLASSDIRSGDLICWLRWPRRAVIVRPQVQGNTHIIKLQAVGTAVVTEDLREPPLSCSQRDEWRKNKLRQTIYLDATTIFTLLA